MDGDRSIYTLSLLYNLKNYLIGKYKNDILFPNLMKAVFKGVRPVADQHAIEALLCCLGGDFDICIMILRILIKNPQSKAGKKQLKGKFMINTIGNNVYLDKFVIKGEWKVKRKLGKYWRMSDVPVDCGKFLLKVDTNYLCNVIDQSGMYDELKKYKLTHGNMTAEEEFEWKTEFAKSFVLLFKVF